MKKFACIIRSKKADITFDDAVTMLHKILNSTKSRRRILLQTSLIKRILNGFRQAYYIGLQSKLFIFKETISILAKEAG